MGGECLEISAMQSSVLIHQLLHLRSHTLTHLLELRYILPRLSSPKTSPYETSDPVPYSIHQSTLDDPPLISSLLHLFYEIRNTLSPALVVLLEVVSPKVTVALKCTAQ